MNVKVLKKLATAKPEFTGRSLAPKVRIFFNHHANSASTGGKPTLF